MPAYLICSSFLIVCVVDNAEVVLQESVEKSNEPLETLNNLKDNEALDEVNAVQEDSTKSLVTENEKDVDVLEEVVEEFEEKSEQLVEPQFVADSVVIKNENNEGKLLCPFK